MKEHIRDELPGPEGHRSGVMQSQDILEADMESFLCDKLGKKNQPVDDQQVLDHGWQQRKSPGSELFCHSYPTLAV
jgi:hypothetical protein